MRRVLLLNNLRHYKLVLFFLLLALFGFAQQPERRPITVKSANLLSSEWLVYSAESKRLVPYVGAEAAENRAYYQWLTIRRDYPFPVRFPANRGLCLFLDNKLIFKADSTSNYSIDLTNIILLPKPEGRHLLAVWSPDLPPRIEDFKNDLPELHLSQISSGEAVQIRNKPRPLVNQSAFILFLLLIGVIYGNLRANFSADFASVFRAGNIFRSYSLEEGFLAKSIGNWSSILFIAGFSLSFSLLIVAIHTNIQNIFIFRQIFRVSESDIVVRIVFNSVLIFGFVLLKYVFLQVLAYIFGLGNVVTTQYREFLRSVLFMGMFLPFVMLLYLAFNQTHPGTVLLASTLAVSTLLVLTALRVTLSLNKKSPLLNLHLFSYLCATEIIPLAVMLKLIVFNY